MSFVALCPYCGQMGRLHNRSLGDSVECPRCHNHYTAAPADEAPVPAAPVVNPPAATFSAPSAEAPPIATPDIAIESPAAHEPVPVAITSAPPAPRLSPSISVAAPPPRRRRGHRWIHLGGLTACLLGSLGLVVASLAGLSILTIPMSAAGLIVGIGAIAHAAGERPLRRVLPIAGTVVSVLVLGVATLMPHLLGPVFEARRQASGFTPSAVLVVPLQIGKDSTPLEIDGWADASRAVLHHDRVRVQIAGVTAGPVLLAVPKGPSKENYLAISVIVQHLGHGQLVEFTHWSAGGVQPTPQPSLTQAGRKSAYHQVETEVVVGQVRQAQRLYPGKALEDLLVFEAGAVGPEPLRLELPAEAWGGRGVLRFHIPAAMIQQKQPSKAK